MRCGWLAGVLLLACGRPPQLAGLWLNESPIPGSTTLLRAWDVGADGTWRRYESSGDWPLSLVEQGTWRDERGRLTSHGEDGRETAWRVRSLTDTTLDVDDVTAVTGHRFFVRGQRCPMPRSSQAWFRFSVRDSRAARPNVALDTSSGAAIVFADGELVEESPDGCGIVRTPVPITETVRGLARLDDGSTAFWFDDGQQLTGALLSGGELVRTALSMGAVGVTSARSAGGTLRVGWLEPGPSGTWSLAVSLPAAGWDTTRTRLDFAPSSAALTTSEDGRAWTVLSGTFPSGEKRTTVTGEDGTVISIPLALRAPFVVRSDGALFAMGDAGWLRVLGNEVTPLVTDTGSEQAAGIGRDGTVFSVRRTSNSALRLREWFAAPTEQTGPVRVTTISVASNPGWALSLGETANGRLNVVGSSVVWLVRDFAAKAGPLGTK